MKEIRTRGKYRRWMTGLGLSALALTVAAPAVAQNHEQRQQRQPQQKWQQHDDWQQRDVQQQRQQQQKRQQQQRANLMRLDPQAWVRVGYDLDRDGRVDVVEDIVAFELQQAKARSEQRQQQRGQRQPRQMGQRSQSQQQGWTHPPIRQQQRDRDMGQAARDRQQQQQARAQREGQSPLRTVHGAVSSLRSESIAGHDHQHLLAKIDTERGTARVDLGPKEDLKQLNIKKGDKIRVSGVRGTLNDRQMLMAHRIETQNDTQFVDREQPIKARRFKGKIQDIRTVTFQESDRQWLVAEVRLQNGKTVPVNLGPKQDLQNINLQRGEEIRVLARPGHIDRRMALIADEVWAKNKNLTIDQPERQKFQVAARGQQSGQ